MKDDLANEDLAHLRALTEPKDDMLKRETHLPKASPVCPVCGLDRPHGHGQAELVALIVKQKTDLAAAQAELQRMTIKWAPVAIERDEARAEAAALRAAWETARRQNAHDMLLSGDEIHQHDAAIAATRKTLSEPVSQNVETQLQVASIEARKERA